MITATVAISALSTVVGCGSSPAEIPAGEDLKGTWDQTGAGFEGGVPSIWEDQILVITTAVDQGFAGYKEYTKGDGKTVQETINSVISPTGVILITDRNGYFWGTLPNGVISGQDAGAVEDDSTAMNMVLTRQ